MSDHERSPQTPELAAEPTPDSLTEAGEQESPWWADPRMPWTGKPGKADMWCWSLITFMGIFALVMLPLRPVLLGYTPYLLLGLTGSRTAMVTVGALGATGDPWWPIGLLIGTVSVVKFDFVYFWAGKLWGKGLVDVLAGRSPRAQRNAARAEKLALKYGVLAVIVTYLPIPFPAAIVYATVALAGMSWKKFAIVNLASAAVLQTIWLVIGWQLGETAVAAVEVFAKYSLWISLAVLAGMIIAMIWRGRKNASAAGAADGAPSSDT